MGRILQVSKIKQLPMYCGPTSLSMVIDFYGYCVDQRKIGKMSGFDPEEGVYPPNLVRCARDLGFRAQGLHNLDFTDIINIINNNHPLIARIQSSLEGFGHMIVIKGFNRRDEVYFNDPLEARGFRMKYKEFEKIWKVNNCEEEKGWKTNNYGILVKP